MERILEYHIGPQTDPRELAEQLRRDTDVAPEPGTRVRFVWDDRLAWVVVGLILLTAVVLFSKRKQLHASGQQDSDSLEELMDKARSETDLEQIATATFNLPVEIIDNHTIVPDENGEDPFDASFGIWKDNPVDPDELRRAAWDRKLEF